MNKTELINAIASESGLDKLDARKALEAFTSCVLKELKAGGKVLLIGFGSFSVMEKSARTGINPATKEVIKIPAKRVPRFKPGVELSEAVK